MEKKKPKGFVVIPFGLGFMIGSGLSSEEVGEARQYVIAKSTNGEVSICGPYSGYNQKAIDDKLNSLFENGEEPEVFEADTDDKQEALELWKITTNQ